MARNKDFELALKVKTDLQNAKRQINQVNDGLDKTGRAGNKADRGARAAARGMKKTQSAGERLHATLGKVVKLLAVAFVAREVSRFASSIVDANEQLFKLAKTAEGLNVSVKFLAGMNEQADALDINIGQLSVVFGTLNRQLATAQRGSKTAKDMFADFGIDPDKVHSTEEAFLAVADSVEKYGLDTRRAGELTQIFGATGKDIVPILKRGSAAIREQNDAMAATGQIITDSNLPRIVELHDATLSISDSVTALRNNLVIQLAPAFSQIADRFNGFVTDEGPKFVDIVSELVDRLPEIAKDFFDIAQAALKAGSHMADALDGIRGYADFLASMKTGHIDQGQGIAQQTAELNALIEKRDKAVAAYARNANIPLINRFPGVRHNGEDALEQVRAMARDSASGRIDPTADAERRQQQFELLSARHSDNQQFIDEYKNSNNALVQEMVKVTRQADDHLKKNLLAAQDIQKAAIQDAGDGKPKEGGKPESVPESPSPSPLSPDAAKMAKRQREAVAAQKQLIDSLIQVQAQADPAAAAWAKYNAAVDKTNELAVTAKRASGANREAIDAERNAIIQMAATARDAALDKIADQDRKAWENLKKSLSTPTEVAVDNALAQIHQLNELMGKGVVTSAEYQEAMRRIGTSSVQAAPQYQGLDAAVGGIGSELSKNFAAQQDLDDWRAKAMEANEAFRAQDLANEEAYQARRAEIESQYADQRVKIEQARGQLTLQASANLFGQLAQLSNSENSKMARIGKAAAIAQATINTYQAATEAYKSLAGIPYVGPALGAAAAAAAIAAGMANVAQIRSQNVGGYAEGGYTGPGGKYQPAGIVHAGEGVLSQRDMAAMGGPRAFDLFRKSLHGYAAGGVVSPLANVPGPSMPAMPAMRLSAPSDASGSSGEAAAQATQSHIHVWSIDEAVERMRDTPGFEKAIVHVVGDNPRTIQSNWSD